MGQSRFSWAVGVIAPWCLGIGLMVSFTAVAGQDAGIGASVAPRSFGVSVPPLDLIPSIATMRQSFGLAQPTQARVRLAALQLGDKVDLLATPDEIEPRRELKSGARAFPVVDRTRRGDPVIGLRPTLDTRLRKSGGIAAYRATELALSPQGALAFDRLAPMEGVTPGPESVSFFELPPEPELAEPAAPAAGAATPSASAVTPTTTSRPALRAAAATQRVTVFDGATPATPRAVALASSTPASVDTPINATALLASQMAANVPVLAKLEEPAAPQATLMVVLNRVSSGLYPTSVCGVVFQNAQRYKACQFSFACEGRSLRVTEAGPWAAARRIARDVLQGRTYVDHVGTATHYHAQYVRPGWSRRLKKTDKIGQHIFYKLRPGQT